MGIRLALIALLTGGLVAIPVMAGAAVRADQAAPAPVVSLR